MTIDERLESISQQLEILTGMQLSNERRFEASERQFEATRKTFESVHESIKSLENIAMAHEQRLDDLEGN
jgi:hypothetical protein